MDNEEILEAGNISADCGNVGIWKHFGSMHMKLDSPLNRTHSRPDF